MAKGAKTVISSFVIRSLGNWGIGPSLVGHGPSSRAPAPLLLKASLEHATSALYLSHRDLGVETRDLVSLPSPIGSGVEDVIQLDQETPGGLAPFGHSHCGPMVPGVGLAPGADRPAQRTVHTIMRPVLEAALPVDHPFEQAAVVGDSQRLGPALSCRHRARRAVGRAFLTIFAESLHAQVYRLVGCPGQGPDP